MTLRKYINKHREKEMSKFPACKWPPICVVIALVSFAIAAFFYFHSPIAPKEANDLVAGFFGILGFFPLFIGFIIMGANDLDIEERLRKAYDEEHKPTH